ncbi:hypothetical protein, partial [uncultured Thiodictyon sp.]|uniref:hypothetical protein n=1 Tax=uncultured Thiodictyon sp. TaxID=1846217 RepID=UPI0025CD5BD3
VVVIVVGLFDYDNDNDNDNDSIPGIPVTTSVLIAPSCRLPVGNGARRWYPYRLAQAPYPEPQDHPHETHAAAAAQRPGTPPARRPLLGLQQ